MTKKILPLVVLLLLVAAAVTSAAAPTKKTVLFNGKDLTGLKVVSAGKGVDPAKVWLAKDGVLRCAGKPYGYIRTEDSYANYRLHVEWRWPDGAGNSGVLVHSVAPDGVYPKSIECQLKSGQAGLVYLFKGTKVKELPADAKRPMIARKNAASENPLGEWNSYDIVCKGAEVTSFVNGVWQNTVTALDETEGWICLQSEGKPIEFRNMYVEPLGAAKRLWNGRDFAGWFRYLRGGKGDVEKTWSVKDGILRCTGKPGGYMRTEAEYCDYKLFVQWRWPETGGNNGVLVHMSKPDKVWPKSLEAQLKTGNAGVFFVIGGVEFKEHADKTNKRVRGRRTDKLHPSNEKKLGGWNQYEIHCIGDTVKLYVNGQLQNVASECTVKKGMICLQSEGRAIEYKDIYIRPIEKK